MKRLILHFCFLVALLSNAGAHVQSPFFDHALNSDQVYLTKIIAVNGASVTFAITEVLRGKEIDKLTLHDIDSCPRFSLNSEWVLAGANKASAYGQDSLGWAMKNDCAWIQAHVIRDEGVAYFPDWGFSSNGLKPDIFLPGGSVGLSVDHLKTLLHSRPKE